MPAVWEVSEFNVNEMLDILFLQLVELSFIYAFIKFSAELVKVALQYCSLNTACKGLGQLVAAT